MREALKKTILIEATTLAELRQAVQDRVDEAIALLALSGDSRRQAVQILQHVSDLVEADVTKIIISARQDAAELATKTVIIEAVLQEPIDIPDNPEDEARAETCARSYAAALLLALLAANILKRKDLRKIAKTQDYRLARIATTEVFEAYGQAALLAYETLPDAADFMKRWDATLDARTCAICRSHAGETVGINQEFSNGDEPGAVHPRCRCEPTLIRVSQRKAA